MKKNSKSIEHIVISIPHAGTRIPPGVNKDQLSNDFYRLTVESSDHFTDKLYDFKDLLGCQTIICKTLPLLVNVNRHPNHIDESAPLLYENAPIYKEGLEPDISQRKNFIDLYHRPYHAWLARQSKSFILDGHSTTKSHHDKDNNTVDYDIIVDDMQYSQYDSPNGIRTAPNGYLDTYIDELERRLPSSVKIIGNAKYMDTYGHIMARHGWDGVGRMGRRAPLILQETDESLYMKNGFPLISEIETLRRIFVEAISVTVTKMSKIYQFT